MKVPRLSPTLARCSLHSRKSDTRTSRLRGRTAAGPVRAFALVLRGACSSGLTGAQKREDRLHSGDIVLEITVLVSQFLKWQLSPLPSFPSDRLR